MSHAVNPFAHIALLALVWLEASGFRCPTDAGPSLGLPLLIPLFPCDVEILQFWVYSVPDSRCYRSDGTEWHMVIVWDLFFK